MKSAATSLSPLSAGIPADSQESTSYIRKNRPGALFHIRHVATKEFADRFRSGWVIACVLVWLGAIGLTSFLGLVQIGRIGVQGYERTATSLLNLIQYLVPLLGLLLGHDIIVGEREEKTARLALAGGLTRSRFLAGKLSGSVLVLFVPFALGFLIAGGVIGLVARDAAIGPFLLLAGSSLLLGKVFLGLGVAISVFSRSRVQALVLALLAWCSLVFVFDLVALGVTVSRNVHAAAEQIDVVCDPTHLNAAVDIHSDLEPGSQQQAQRRASIEAPRLGALALNPIDLFRLTNLRSSGGVSVATWEALLAVGLWLTLPFAAALWKLQRSDL